MDSKWLQAGTELPNGGPDGSAFGSMTFPNNGTRPQKRKPWRLRRARRPGRGGTHGPAARPTFAFRTTLNHPDHGARDGTACGVRDTSKAF